MTPICKPTVNAEFHQMSRLQRATECFRYVVLFLEHWISPEGRIRNWLQINFCVCAWLLIPALFVLPIVSVILWQFAFWWSLFTGVAGKLVLIALLIVGVRMIRR